MATYIIDNQVREMTIPAEMPYLYRRIEINPVAINSGGHSDGVFGMRDEQFSPDMGGAEIKMKPDLLPGERLIVVSCTIPRGNKFGKIAGDADVMAAIIAAVPPTMCRFMHEKPGEPEENFTIRNLVMTFPVEANLPEWLTVKDVEIKFINF